MNPTLSKTISGLVENFKITDERKATLQPLIDFIQDKKDKNLPINLNFICTHNSRRSHLSQVWAQVAAAFYKVPNVSCYSGGTEETALFPKVAETLSTQGFQVLKISVEPNPVYAIKFDENPMIGLLFSSNLMA